VISCNSAAEFKELTNVSRETLAKLDAYAALLVKWQQSINLVSNTTLDDLWRRHFLDSAQIAPLITEYGPQSPQCIDMGAGAGFPGLVLSAMGFGQWTLIESDARKCVFLSEVVRQCEISATVRAERVEGIKDLQADIVTARAFAPLHRLLAYVEPLMKPTGLCIFPKGQRADEELAAARANWSFEVEEHQSQTDEAAKILVIQKVTRV